MGSWALALGPSEFFAGFGLGPLRRWVFGAFGPRCFAFGPFGPWPYLCLCALGLWPNFGLFAFWAFNRLQDFDSFEPSGLVTGGSARARDWR